ARPRRLRGVSGAVAEQGHWRSPSAGSVIPGRGRSPRAPESIITGLGGYGFRARRNPSRPWPTWTLKPRSRASPRSVAPRNDRGEMLTLPPSQPGATPMILLVPRRHFLLELRLQRLAHRHAVHGEDVVDRGVVHVAEAGERPDARHVDVA